MTWTLRVGTRRPGNAAYRSIVQGLILGAAWTISVVATGPPAVAACPRCLWAPPETKTNLTVRSVSELMTALSQARPGTTILLEDGDYLLTQKLNIPTPDLVLRGKSGDRSRVMIRGEGMTEKKIGVAILISARVTVADLSVGAVGFHGIQVRGEAQATHAVIHNVRIVDTGQQLIKGSVGGDGRGADEGVLACSTLEYSDHAPSDYTDGIDVLGARGWTVSDNRFLRIRGLPEQEGKALPAILFWRKSQDTRIEGNLLLDCYRGIALGIGPGPQDATRNAGDWFDHRGGVIRRNVVCNLAPGADEAIEVNGAPGVRIEHNTVLVEGRLPWSISVRFPPTTGVVQNNLTNRSIELRDSARTELRGNVTFARRDWFLNPARGDLRLARGDVAAIDAGVPAPEGRPRSDLEPPVTGKAPDAGAFEYAGGNRRFPR